jgi:PTS system nitrogen regulatory IIA component
VAKAGFLAATASSNPTARRLETMLRTGGIWRDVPAAEVRDRMAAIVARLPGATAPVRQLLAQRMRTPEGISWAAVGDGFALPHLRVPIALGRDAGIFAILLLRDALQLSEPSPDNIPITHLVFFIAPSPRAHLELLSQLSAALIRGNLRRLLQEGAPDDQIFAALAGVESGATGANQEGRA